MCTRNRRWIGVQKAVRYINSSIFQAMVEFRTKKTIWSDYIFNKYCRKYHPKEVVRKVGNGSQVWKKMLQARDMIDHLIVCQVRGGDTHLW